MVRKWIWISVVVLFAGCAHSQKIKVVTDIDQSGEVTYHTEYIAEF